MAKILLGLDSEDRLNAFFDDEITGYAVVTNVEECQVQEQFMRVNEGIGCLYQICESDSSQYKNWDEIFDNSWLLPEGTTAVCLQTGY